MTVAGVLATVRAGLVGSLDAKLVDELLNAYVDAKLNFFAGGLRLSAVEGGRFCEAAFRLLQQAAGLPITALGKMLDTEKLIDHLAKLPSASHPEAIRIHVPRSLRVVYDVRNKRDAAHLADGIDPNVQDATLVVSVLDWVLAELVRLYHSVPPNEAQRLVESLVERKAPAVQSFGDFLKVLNPNLKAGDRMLLLLYQRGPDGATFEQLDAWAKPSMRGNLRRTLTQLEDERALIHCDGTRFYITQSGSREVERRRLIDPIL
jgi:hypothetical protein